MKFKKPYRTIRILIAAIFMMSMIGAFVGIKGGALVPRLQFGPAVIAYLGGVSTAAILIIAVTLVVTLLFGRFYCAVVCPWGVLQDWVGWLFKRKNSPKKNHFILRYGIAFLSFGLLSGGSVALFRFLDPYSNFGTLLTAVMKPSVATWLGAATPFVALFALVFWKRRIFCVALCPIGTLLGIVGKRALFRLSISDSCAGCGLCEKVCPTGCVDLKRQFIDNERCVCCLNCLSVCQKDAIRYGVFTKANRSRIHPSEEIPFGTDVTKVRRRSLFAACGGFFALGIIGIFTGRKIQQLKRVASEERGKSLPILPPGADVPSSFTEQCVDCGLCVAVCPGKAIQTSPGRMGAVQIHYNVGFCEFDCADCGKVCPTQAIRPLTLAEKQAWIIGQATFDPQFCLAVQDKVACGGCVEDCPTAAMVIQLSPTFFHIPRLDPLFCLGCGACVAACRREHSERSEWKGKPLAISVAGVSAQKSTSGTDALRQAIRLIRHNGVAADAFNAVDCVLIQDGQMIAQGAGSGRGVSSLWTMLEKEGEKRKGGTVVDRVIGRAAAAILIQANVASVYGELMSEDAVEFLTLYGIGVGYTRLVPRILNSSRDDLCPLEKSVEGLDDPAEVVEVLKKRVE